MLLPRGGIMFAEALEPYASNRDEHPWLIVDDVLNTGSSMNEERDRLRALGVDAIGIVAFARQPCPDWVYPIFQFWPEEAIPWTPRNA